jgi:CRP/FNR family transcriptional activator FtrB
VFGREAAFARAVVDELAERYRGVVRALKNEKLRTGPVRLANWILREDARQGETHRISLTVDKRTLASRLGMTPENLSRNLGQLASYGVRTSGRTIIVDDMAKLSTFAKPNALMDG